MVLTRLLGGRMPEAILFDLDGTLVDSAPDLAAATDRMLAQLGRPPVGEQQVRLWVGNGATMLVRRALAGSADPALIQALDEAEVTQAIRLFFTAYENCNGDHCRIYPGVTELLRALEHKGSGMAVVTNKPARFTTPLLAKMGLAGYFPVQVSGDTLPTKKPAPEPLHFAVEQLGASRFAALMVGDSVNDIQAAHAADMPVVAVSYGYNHGRDVRDEGADLVVDSLSELL